MTNFIIISHFSEKLPDLLLVKFSVSKNKVRQNMLKFQTEFVIITDTQYTNYQDFSIQFSRNHYHFSPQLHYYFVLFRNIAGFTFGKHFEFSVTKNKVRQNGL